MKRKDRQADEHDDEHDRRGARTADVRGEGIRVDRHASDAGVAEARLRFGGLDWLASFAGLLAAIGTLVLLGGLAGAAGTVGYQMRGGDDDLSIGGLIAGLVVLLIAFFTGGWVAGRVGRYDGGRNGVMTALLFLALAAGLAGLGAWLGDRYDVFEELDLPQWFTTADLGPAALGSAVAGAVVALLAGWLGGTVGARYHRRADALVTRTRNGGLLGAERTGAGAQGGEGAGLGARRAR